MYNKKCRISAYFVMILYFLTSTTKRHDNIGHGMLYSDVSLCLVCKALKVPKFVIIIN